MSFRIPEFSDNIMFLTDSYKVAQYPLYPPKTSLIQTYLEARCGGEYKEVMFFGLQYIMLRYMAGRVVTQKKIDRAAELYALHFRNDRVFNRRGSEHILHRHDGRLPLRIRAVPEGMIIPEGNVLINARNTCPDCYWLTNYLEDLYVHTWYGSTVGNISREMKKMLWNALVRSGTATLEKVKQMLHDFAVRGCSSFEQAAIGGTAHLVNFFGTDNVPALLLARQYYGAPMAGFSIPASEHSCVGTWGQGFENEVEYCENYLRQYPDMMIASVSDNWNVVRCIGKIWGQRLRDKVINRNGILVFRPDSGDPREVLPELYKIIANRFGSSLNSKGYNLLFKKTELMQGDHVKRTTLQGMLDAIMDAGWSIDSQHFGSGGGLLMDCNRDTQRFAAKCSYTERNGVGHDVFKKPVTDPTKNSKRGQQKLVLKNGKIVTVREEKPGVDILQDVFLNGDVLVKHKMDEIIDRAELPELVGK